MPRIGAASVVGRIGMSPQIRAATAGELVGRGAATGR